jgi:hypothetical protein
MEELDKWLLDDRGYVLKGSAILGGVSYWEDST